MVDAFERNDGSDDDERLLQGFWKYRELFDVSYDPLFRQEADAVLLLEHVRLNFTFALDLMQQIVSDDELWWNSLQAQRTEVIDAGNFNGLYREWQIGIDTFPDHRERLN